MGAFTDSVDPSAFTVLNPPDYIFLCGGPLKDLKHSLRAQFHENKVKADPGFSKRVLLAEKADEWYLSHRQFEDLLELEEYLAGLSACILLFVESPGAIAEFGAFSQMPRLRDKLIVVVEQAYFRQTSFIRNGPIQQTIRNRPRNILFYPWLTTPVGGGPKEIDTANLGNTLDEVAREVQSILAKKPKTTNFLKEDHGHRMLLVADLIRLSVVIQLLEIQKLITDLGIIIKTKELKNYLYLLEQLGIISTEPYGGATYFISAKGTPDHIGYAPKTPADRARLRSMVHKDLPVTRHKKLALDAFEHRLAGVAP